MKKHKGWVIVQLYKHKKKTQERPVSVSRVWNTSKIGLSGYIYIYPTKKCAELDIMKLSKWKSKFKAIKVLVQKY